jgi:MFS family permease
MSVCMLTGSRVLPTLIAALGIRTVMTMGCLLVAASSGFFALFHGSLWEAFVMMGVLGAGLGTTYAAIPGLIVQAVPAGETGSAMGFYQVVRYVGFSLGSALTASIVASKASATGQPTLAGYTTALWISVAICAVAAALPWLLATRRDQVAPEQRIDDAELRLLEETEGDSLLRCRPVSNDAH